MRLMTNDELFAVGGGDQIYEHVEKRMTDEEKAEYDREVSRLASAMDDCLTGNPAACAIYFTGQDWPQMPDLPNLIDWNSFGN